MPKGFDLTTEKGLVAAMPFMEAKHFLFPFLAHAFGTFIAALLIFVLMKEKSNYYSFFAAALFFLGGAYMVRVLPAPLWFNVTDLVLAYFPMVFLAQWLVEKRKGMKLN
jgi:TctA family transporter